MGEIYVCSVDNFHPEVFASLTENQQALVSSIAD